MASGRRLRERYRDESLVALLMDVPRWTFVLLMLVAIVALLLLGGLIDVALNRPNVVLTILTPLLLVAFFGGLFWLASRDRALRHRRLTQTSNAHRLSILMPDEMADLAAELFRQQGYVVTENKRPDLADGGVDFEILKEGKVTLVQVKHWRQEVGVKDVRELWGIVASERAAGGVLIGTSGFSARAREFAAGKELRLIDGPEFLELRSQLPRISRDLGEPDPLVSQGYARHVAGLHPPACGTCGKPMVVVTRLQDTTVVYQLWGCPDYPKCQGTRRFAFPYEPGIAN